MEEVDPFERGGFEGGGRRVLPPSVLPFSLYLVPFDFIVYFSVFPSPVLFIMRTGPQAKERESGALLRLSFLPPF